MSKSVVIGVVVAVVVVAGGGILLAANHSSDNNKKDTGTTTNDMNMHGDTSSTTGDTGSGSAPTNTSSISIADFAFSPANIAIKKGTTVAWTNKDSAAHTVTETDGQTGPDSGDLATGKTYSFTYDSVGTFKYHCSIHSSMTGTVTVTE